MKEKTPKNGKFIQEYLYIEEYEPKKDDRKKRKSDRENRQPRGVIVIDVF